MFIEAVRPVAVLSLSLQELNTDIVLCIECTLKIFKVLNCFTNTGPIAMAHCETS